MLKWTLEKTSSKGGSFGALENQASGWKIERRKSGVCVGVLNR